MVESPAAGPRPERQNLSRKDNCIRRAFVPSGCDPSLLGVRKLLLGINAIGALRGVAAVVATELNAVEL